MKTSLNITVISIQKRKPQEPLGNRELGCAGHRYDQRSVLGIPISARTSSCRKLHNIVNSVVVLDEAQLLNPEFLQPIMDTINLLARYYGVTVVLTATQPALNSRDGFGWTFRGLDDVREIMTDPDTLYRDLNRVTVEMPPDFHVRRGWEEILIELIAHESVLAIVNTRHDCRELYRLMPEGTIHLSAAMCGEHRSQVIADIRERLERKSLRGSSAHNWLKLG